MIEHLASIDIGSFRKQALLDDAIHLRTHFSDQTGRRSTGQFGRDHYLLLLHCHNGNFWSYGLSAFGLLSTASQDQESG